METVSRQERKDRTRQSILDAALTLTEESGLATLSLRAVAKEVGIVPTAFYRHFASIEELGLALVDSSFASLREMLREVRRGNPDVERIIENSVDILARHVRDRRGHFGFIARERVAGPPVVREAVRHELELTKRELAMDLVRLPGPSQWSAEDVHVLADLVVTSMVGIVDALLALPPERTDAEKAVVANAETQLRMVVVGAANWTSGS